jgi:hypothetical protein
LASDLEIARKKISDYAMALDLLARLSHSDSEKQAIANIIEIFTILFSPKKVQYHPVVRGQKGEENFLPPRLDNEGTSVGLQISSPAFTGKYVRTDSKKGFFIKISHQKTLLGIIEVEEILFQEYIEQYINLALSIVDVCGLIIDNARKHERLKENEQRLRQEKEKVEQALEQVKQLSGLLPICMHCKKIRDDKGYWNKLESYIQNHSEAEFSHGICEVCLEEFYPEE